MNATDIKKLLDGKLHIWFDKENVVFRLNPTAPPNSIAGGEVACIIRELATELLAYKEREAETTDLVSYSIQEVKDYLKDKYTLDQVDAAMTKLARLKEMMREFEKLYTDDPLKACADANNMIAKLHDEIMGEE